MSALDDLLGDPGTRRCWEEVVTGEKPLSLDGVLSCYGDDEPEPGVRSVDLAALLGIPFHDVERGIYVLPRTLVEKIERSYAEVSRAGFLTKQDFEQSLYEQFSAVLGVELPGSEA